LEILVIIEKLNFRAIFAIRALRFLKN